MTTQHKYWINKHKRRKKHLKYSKKKIKTLHPHIQYNINLIVRYFGSENTIVRAAKETNSCYIMICNTLVIRLSDHTTSRRRFRIRKNKPALYYTATLLLTEEQLQRDVERVLLTYEGIL